MYGVLSVVKMHPHINAIHSTYIGLFIDVSQQVCCVTLSFSKPEYSFCGNCSGSEEDHLYTSFIPKAVGSASIICGFSREHLESQCWVHHVLNWNARPPTGRASRKCYKKGNLVILENIKNKCFLFQIDTTDWLEKDISPIKVDQKNWGWHESFSCFCTALKYCISWCNLATLVTPGTAASYWSQPTVRCILWVVLICFKALSTSSVLRGESLGCVVSWPPIPHPSHPS